MDSLKKNLDGVANFILIMGCIISGIAGFICLVVLPSTDKLVGLIIWIVGPLLCITCSIMIHGVALKQNETDETLAALAKQNEMLVKTNKKLEKIVRLLDVNHIYTDAADNNENDSKVVSEGLKINKDVNTTKETTSTINPTFVNATKEETRTIFNYNETKTNSSNTINVEKIEGDKVKTSTINVDYATNINNCVLFANSLTLDIGETVDLDYATELDRVGNNVLFTINGKRYSIEFLDLFEACKFMDRLRK